MIANIHHAKTHLSQLIERALAGEEVVIARNGAPVARLTSLADYRRPRTGPNGLPAWLGSLKGRIWMAPDIDAIDEEIASDFEASVIEP